MSDNNLDFMDRLTSDHKGTQNKAKSGPLVIDIDYEIPTKPMEIDVSGVERDCLYKCGSVGVPILPVVFSQTDYKLNSNDERYFIHSLSDKSPQHNALASLPTNTYLYSYTEKDYGDGIIYDKLVEYFIGNDGSLRVSHEYSVSELKEESSQDGIQLSSYNSEAINENGSQSFNCTRAQHSTLASKYIVLDYYETIWMMVSHVRLSKKILKKYVQDSNLREKRMQKFVAQDLMSNQNTQVMNDSETNYIKSFHRRKNLANGDDIDIRMSIKEQSAMSTRKRVGEDLKYVRESHSAPNNSKEAARALYDRMAHGINEEIEKYEDILESHDNPTDRQRLAFYKTVKPMMVALPDPVGEVLAAAEKRNYLLKKLDDAQNDKSKIREQVNAIIIDNIRSSIESGTGYDSSVPQAPGTMGYHITGRNEISQANNKNIYNYIDEAKFKAVLEEAKKSREDKVAIAAARQTFVEAITNPEFARIMREDFLDDEDSHAGYCQIIADAIQGIGIDESNIGIPDSIWADYKPEQAAGMTAKQEFEQSLLPCISGEKPIEDNWLIKALIGLNPEDNQKMENAPSFENLARAADFVGTSTSWVLAFKNRQQQNKINTAIAAQRDSINKLANHKAQILLTMSTNMAHIKDNNKFLYKLDLWSQATVHQSTGFRLAQKVLKYSPEVILNYGSQRLTHTINKAKPHSALLPASIDTNAVGTSSSTKAPIAIDFQKTYGIGQKMTDVFDKAAAGNKTAQTVVTMYTSEESARATQTINQDLEQQVAQLNRDLDPISGQHRQLERQSAGKAALLSAGIGLFQLRSMWIGKNSIGAMAGRGDRVGLEYMTGYASTTLALSSASVDVVNAGIQMKAARSVWVTRLGLSVGVLGAVGAGFEVYSLSISLERQLEGRSYGSAIATGVAAGAAVTAGVSGAAIALGFTMPWLVGIMAVAWGVSLIAQWVAFRYDKGHILPIHYWLDAGVFGNKAMINSEYPNNPFKERPMQNIQEDLHAYALAMTEFTVTPNFNTSTRGNASVLTGTITVNINQWQENSWLGIYCYVVNNNGDEITLENDYNKSSRITHLIELGQAKQQGDQLVITKELPQIMKRVYADHSYRGYDINASINALSKQEKKESNYLTFDDMDRLEVIVDFQLDASTNPMYELSNKIKSN